jgi:hypothetical protein
VGSVFWLLLWLLLWLSLGVAVCAYSAAMRRTATLPVDRFVPTDRVS